MAIAVRFLLVSSQVPRVPSAEVASGLCYLSDSHTALKRLLLHMGGQALEILKFCTKSTLITLDSCYSRARSCSGETLNY